VGGPLGRRHVIGPVHAKRIHETSRVDLRKLAGADRHVRSTGLEKVNGIAELSWEIYRDTVIEQCEQGVDSMTCTPACCCGYVPLTARGSRHRPAAGAIMARGARDSPGKLLYTTSRNLRHPADYDVTFSLARAAARVIADARRASSRSCARSASSPHRPRSRRASDDRGPRPRSDAQDRGDVRLRRRSAARRRSTRSPLATDAPA